MHVKVKVSKKYKTNSQGVATLQRRPSLVNGCIMLIALWISIVMGQRKPFIVIVAGIMLIALWISIVMGQRIPFIVIVAGGFMPQGQRRKV